MIIGQAPGSVVHASGIPWDDASGNRLREWMGISKTDFYDETKVAIVPMGFCYPGSGPGGDLPPRPECADHWRAAALAKLRSIKLTLVIGQYARRYHLKGNPGSLTDLIRGWEKFWPDIVPLPHPSPRNNRWLSKNPWFESELLPELKKRIQQIINSPDQ